MGPTLKVILFVVIVGGLFSLPAEAASSCQIETSLPTVKEMASGIVAGDSFSADFSGGQRVFVKIRNDTIHGTPATVTLRAGTIVCISQLIFLPQRTVIFSGATFGDEPIAWHVDVDPGEVDVQQLSVNIYTYPPPIWTGVLYNIDDVGVAVLNGAEISRCSYRQTCSFSLNDRLKPGKNLLNIRFENNNDAIWMYGFKIFMKNFVRWEGKCGDVGIKSCGGYLAGIVFSQTYEIRYW